MPKLPQWVVPTWLERLGRASWLALGLAIAALIVVWLFAATRTITLPLLLALAATLKLHPLGVLLATTIGGVLGGAIASAMAAPFVAISRDVVRQIHAAGIFVDEQGEEASPESGQAGGRGAP